MKNTICKKKVYSLFGLMRSIFFNVFENWKKKLKQPNLTNNIKHDLLQLTFKSYRIKCSNTCLPYTYLVYLSKKIIITNFTFFSNDKQ